MNMEGSLSNQFVKCKYVSPKTTTEPWSRANENLFLRRPRGPRVFTAFSRRHTSSQLSYKFRCLQSKQSSFRRQHNLHGPPSQYIGRQKTTSERLRAASFSPAIRNPGEVELEAFQRVISISKAICFLTLLFLVKQASAQAALLLEQPYGFFGAINPTGHAAVYLENICADSPVHLRMCGPKESGVVVSRYKGMAGYDWMAIPLVPYLYAVDDPSLVPASADADTVFRMRNDYREKHLDDLGRALPEGGFFSGGWTELSGAAYDRRMFAFRFATTRSQDEALVTKLNARDNKSHFNMLFNNCSDFDRLILNNYFPAKFGRSLFPDAGITTPKHITYTLKKYGVKHPEAELAIYAIPQIPGSRRKMSRDSRCCGISRDERLRYPHPSCKSVHRRRPRRRLSGSRTIQPGAQTPDHSWPGQPCSPGRHLHANDRSIDTSPCRTRESGCLPRHRKSCW